MTKYEVNVKGSSPFLYNRFRDKTLDVKSKKRTGGVIEEDPEEKLYLKDGKPYIPSIYFRNSMIEAGKSFRIVGKGKSNFSKLIGATVDVKPDEIENNHKWTPFRISAVNPTTKGRVMVTRPKMDNWKCTFEIILNDEAIDGDTMKDILEYAGKYVGVGDWRPQKKGMFGKFIITSFNEVK